MPTKSEMKRELVNDIAMQLKSYGYTVYLSKSREYGFYTDGTRVVCFGGSWTWSVKLSGNYRSQHCGTGWVLTGEISFVSKELADGCIKAHAPTWATRGEAITYTTPEQHLATYGKSSGYTEFQLGERDALGSN